MKLSLGPMSPTSPTPDSCNYRDYLKWVLGKSRLGIFRFNCKVNHGKI